MNEVAATPSPEARIASLLKLTAKEIRPCKLCNVTIYLVEHRNGKRAPYTIDGLNHFSNCKYADQFRKRRQHG